MFHGKVTAFFFFSVLAAARAGVVLKQGRSRDGPAGSYGAEGEAVPAVLDPVCLPATVFESTVVKMQSEVDSARLKLLASFERVVAEGQAEAQSIGQLDEVFADVAEKVASCQRQASEAKRDARMYFDELQELQRLAKAETSGRPTQNWTALLLLGERSVSDVRREGEAVEFTVSAGVKRAAEMHWGLARAARRATACLGSEEGTCRTSAGQLREAYKEAYAHISGLMGASRALADDSECMRIVLGLLDKTRAPIERRIAAARRGACEGEREGAEAEVHAREAQRMMEKAQGMLSQACDLPEWIGYAEDVSALSRLVVARPRCERCCAGTDASDYGLKPGYSLLSAEKQQDQKLDALLQKITGLRERWRAEEEAWRRPEEAPLLLGEDAGAGA